MSREFFARALRRIFYWETQANSRVKEGPSYVRECSCYGRGNQRLMSDSGREGKHNDVGLLTRRRGIPFVYDPD